MTDRSPSKIVATAALGLLVFYGIKYFNANFSSSELLERADASAGDEGCAAAMPLYDRAVEHGACNDFGR